MVTKQLSLDMEEERWVTILESLSFASCHFLSRLEENQDPYYTEVIKDKVAELESIKTEIEFNLLN